MIDPDAQELITPPRVAAHPQLMSRAALALTVANVSLGVIAILLVLDAATGVADRNQVAHLLTLAGGSVLAAMVCDLLDGVVARVTGTTSALGKELDSLADVISFGVAPAVLAVAIGGPFLAPPEAGGSDALAGLAVVVAIAYVVCAAYRLARFKQPVEVGPSNPAGGNGRYFAGMPSTAAAGMVAATVGMLGGHPLPSTAGSLAFLALVAGLALLMVSRWRFRSQRDLARLPVRSPVFLAAGVAALAALVVAPIPVLFAAAATYTASGVLVRLTGR